MCTNQKIKVDGSEMKMFNPTPTVETEHYIEYLALKYNYNKYRIQDPPYPFKFVFVSN